MVNLATIIPVIFLSTIVFTLISVVIDYRKVRLPKTNPFISFIIPTHNDGNTLENTLKSIYESYNNFEIIIINDCSTDNTLEILNTLQSQYNFTLINNPINLGKTKSINNAAHHSHGEIIIMIDSDTILNKPAVHEMISRLEDEKVGAVSCRCKPINEGFLAQMQKIECGMTSSVFTTHNPFSTFGLWGCCIAIKREVFESVGLLTENAICEDMDLALKIGKSGWKVHECSKSVLVDVATRAKPWFKQKMRVMSGSAQNYLKHYSFFLMHPIFILFASTYLIMNALMIILTIHNIAFAKEFFSTLSITTTLPVLAGFFIFPLFSSHCLALNENIVKSPEKILWLFPYALIYFPISSFIAFLGSCQGVYKYFTLKKEDRAW